MPLKKVVVERLDQIGHNRGPRRPMKEDDLVHRERSAKPRLIDVGATFGRGRVGEDSGELEFGEPRDRRARRPQPCGRIRRFPRLEEKVVQFVGADEMGDVAQPVDLPAQVLIEPDRRPDPEAARIEADDDAARRVGEAEKADDVAFHDPEPLAHLLEPCHLPPCRMRVRGCSFGASCERRQRVILTSFSCAES